MVMRPCRVRRQRREFGILAINPEGVGEIFDRRPLLSSAKTLSLAIVAVSRTTLPIVRSYPMSSLDALWKLLRTAVGVFWDLLTFFRLTFRTPQAVAAENLFLRKQFALYVERKTKPHRATDAVRFTLAQLSRSFEWRHVSLS